VWFLYLVVTVSVWYNCLHWFSYYYCKWSMEHSLVCSRDLDIVISWQEEDWGLWSVDLEKMEQVNWKDNVTNTDVLQILNETRSVLDTIWCWKHSWLGCVLWHDGLLKEIQRQNDGLNILGDLADTGKSLALRRKLETGSLLTFWRFTNRIIIIIIKSGRNWRELEVIYVLLSRLLEEQLHIQLEALSSVLYLSKFFLFLQLAVECWYPGQCCSCMDDGSGKQQRCVYRRWLWSHPHCYGCCFFQVCLIFVLRAKAVQLLLHFMWGVAEAKCTLVTAVCVCLSVACHPTLLLGPECNLGEW